MKKIIIILYFILTISIAFLFFYGNSKHIKLKYYTIRENISFVYEKNRKMTFNIYSESDSPMIIYPEYNSYTLRLDKLSFTLENVEIDVVKGDEINLIKITADMPSLTDSELISQSCSLDIINGEYSLLLDLGSFSILNSDYYENIKLDSLSGSFSNVDGFFNLVGVNLTLNEDKEYLKEFRVGGFTIGNLGKVKSKVKYENEINIYDMMPDYVETKYDNNFTLGIKDKMMFIPLGFKMSYLTRCGYMIFEFEDKKYYFDAFPFMTTNPDFNKYKNYLKEGVIYA